MGVGDINKYLRNITITVLIIILSCLVMSASANNADADSELWFYKNDTKTISPYMGGLPLCGFKTEIEAINQDDSVRQLKSDGNAVCFLYSNAYSHTEAQMNMSDEQGVDLEAYKDGYLFFDIYVRTDATAETTDNFGFFMRNRENYASGKYYKMYDLNVNSWQEVKIPVASLMNNNLDIKKIYRLSVYNTTTLNGYYAVYLQNIRFAKSAYPVNDISDSVTWTNVPIGGGGMICGIAFHPTEKNLVYARTDVGGAYRFDNDLNKWIPLLDSFDVNSRNYYSVYGIGIAPTNPDILYLAVGGSWYDSKGVPTVLKSEDRGNTWIKTGIMASEGMQLYDMGVGNYYGECIAVDSANADIVYCGTRFDGLHISRDGGATWTKSTYIPDCGITSDDVAEQGIHSVVANKNGDVFVAVDGYGVYMSTDRGMSFSCINNSPQRPQNIRVLNDDVYVTADDNGKGKLYVYRNSLWYDMTPADSEGLLGGLEVVSDGNGNAAVFVSELKSSKIYRWYNSAWILLSEEFNKSNTDFEPYMAWKVGSHDVAVHNTEYLAVNPFPETYGKIELYVATGDGLYTSYPMDINGTEIRYYANTNGIEETCVNTVVSVPGGNILVGIMDYSGFSINDISSHSGVKMIYKITDNKFCDVISSFDYCKEYPEKVVAFADDDINNDKVKGFVVVSEDGGSSWKACKYPETNLTGMGDVAVAADVQENGYPIILAIGRKEDVTSGESAKVLRSEDFGESWTECNGLPENLIVGVYALSCDILESDKVDKNVFYAYDYLRGDFYVSRDGGKNFVKTCSIMPEKENDTNILSRTVKANPKKAGEVYFTCGSKGVYKSTDFGQTFTLLGGIQNVDGFAFGAEKYGNPCMYVLGDVYGKNGLYVSYDNGETWNKMNDADNGLGCFVKGIEGDKTFPDRVYVATGGRGVIVGGVESVFNLSNASDGITVHNGENTIMLTDISSRSRNSNIIIALYKEDGVLSRVIEFEKTFLNGGVKITFNLDKTTEGMYIKCFNWSADGSITPYSPSLECRVKETH